MIVIYVICAALIAFGLLSSALAGNFVGVILAGVVTAALWALVGLRKSRERNQDAIPLAKDSTKHSNNDQRPMAVAGLVFLVLGAIQIPTLFGPHTPPTSGWSRIFYEWIGPVGPPVIFSIVGGLILLKIWFSDRNK